MQLSSKDRYRVESAREILEASMADQDPANYARHLAHLEVSAGWLLEIIDHLTTTASDGMKGVDQ